MINSSNYDIRGEVITKRSVRTSEKEEDKKIIEDSGKSMRFFLNLSFALIIAFPLFAIYDPRWLSSGGVIVFAIPFIITTIFFIAFLRLLKRMEKYATQERNIKLVSRIIWEFNRSSLIRLAIGKTKTFMDEEGG